MTVTITLPGNYREYRQQSFYTGNHHAVRSRKAREGHDLVAWMVREQLGTDVREMTPPVIVTVTEYAVRPADPGNSPEKILVDGIVKAGLLPDDNYQVIRELRLRSRKCGRADERVEITIEEVE